MGKVTVLGVDGSFWPKQGQPAETEFWSGEEREVVLNSTLANALDVKVGAEVTLNLQPADNVPRETLLGKRKVEDVNLIVKVRKILPDEGMARFSLKPTPEPVRNAFVPIRLLQKRLGLADRANALFVAGAKPTLQADVQKQLTLEDWGLRFLSPKDRAEAFVRILAGHSPETDLKRIRWQGRVPDELAASAEKNGGILTMEQVIAYYEKNRAYSVLESQRMLLEPTVVQAAESLVPGEPADAAKPARWQLTPMLIYLADTLGDRKLDTPLAIDIPYAIIAGGVPILDGKKPYVLRDNEILLVKWKGMPAKIKPGSKIFLTYYVPDKGNNLGSKIVEFKVHSIVDLEGVLDDPDLTPAFPGITDKLDMASWENPPFSYNPKRIKAADEAYWKRYRTTPKAYVNFNVAQKLWKSRFGDLTSIQVRKGLETPDKFPAALLEKLTPEQGGFVFQPVREQALRASSGTNDFGMLFIGFSFFLIVSGLLLVGLLVRLNIDRRAGEMGLLLAVGWSHRQVRLLLLGEGALLAVVGGLAGLAGALFYADMMLKLLAANWPDGENLNFLHLHVEPMSLAIGYAASLIVSVLTMVWATHVLGQLSPRSLLFGETSATGGPVGAKPGWSRWLIPAGLVGALALVFSANLAPSHEGQSLSFFGSGALLLTACLAAVWQGLKWVTRFSTPQPTLGLLGIRNAGRNAVRSLLTVGLLAAASFLIVAVESFHKDTDRDFAQKSGGSGGFPFFAEGNIPVYEDLNDAKVRIERGLAEPDMRLMKIFPCRVQPGDDASCLNLYKPLKPRVMSVSDALVERGGFRFESTQAQTPEGKKESLAPPGKRTDEWHPRHHRREHR